MASSRTSRGVYSIDVREGHEWPIFQVVIGSGVPDRSGVVLQ